MAHLPPAWAAYGRMQSKLQKLSRLDDTAWGLEAGLSVILEPDFSPDLTLDEDLTRVAASAARRERDHVTRFHSTLEDDTDFCDPSDFLAMISARAILRAVEVEVVNPRDLELVVQLAAGSSYADLATALEVPEESLRSRVCRLRRSIAHLRL